MQPAPPLDDEERWTTDNVAVRDATREGGARPRAEKTLTRFVDDLRALGFEELGFVGTRFLTDLCLPELDAADFRALEADVTAGVDGAEERLAWARDVRSVQRLWDSDHLSWLWRHPTTGDVACLERTDDGDWLTISRWHEDGTLVRTVRRPEGYAPGAPGATGLFVDAPLPGLHRLMCRLGGDQFVIGKGPKPALRQWDQTTGSVPVPDVWATHCAEAERRAGTSPVAVLDLDTVLATFRRTMHVTLEGLARAEDSGWFADLAATIAGVLAAALLVAVATGSVGVGVAFAAVLSWAAGRGWAVACGGAPTTAVLLPTAAVLAGARLASLAPAPLAGAITLAFAGAAAGRLLAFWLGQAGRVRYDPRQTSPPPVTLDELRRLYRA